MLLERLVLASGNPGKLREFRQLCEPLGITIVAQAELGIAEAEEPTGSCRPSGGKGRGEGRPRFNGYGLVIGNDSCRQLDILSAGQ